MNCKYGVLQYVLVKIVTTIVVVVLEGMGRYKTGDWSLDSAYGYISVILNLSIGYALYCLVKLYYATKEDLKEWNPIGKFLCIKGIVSQLYRDSLWFTEDLPLSLHSVVPQTHHRSFSLSGRDF